MKYKVAFATDDGKNMINRHFGEAEFYVLYEISKKEAIYIEKRENSTDEEDEQFHGDPNKAGKIGMIMKGVQVLCNKQFGSNIQRMKKKFLPVLFDIDSIEEAIKIIQNRFEEIEEQWNAGEERKHITFRTK